MGMGHGMHGIFVVGLTLLLRATTVGAQEQPKLNLMPMPATVQTGSGSLRIDASFSVALTGHTEPLLDRAVHRFTRQLSRQTALPFSLKALISQPLTGQTDPPTKGAQNPGKKESYTLPAP